MCSQCARDAQQVKANSPAEAQSLHAMVAEGMFTARARTIVFDYVKAHLEKTDTHVTFARDEVYIVWFNKTLQHWKALLSTSLPDGMYYEVTYNGDTGDAYLDAYKKFDNVTVVL